jgi:hypothetical protein
MSYFAKVEDDIVTTVIVAEQDFIDTQEGTWVQTYYDGSTRKNYAGTGFTYDSTRDAFIEPKRFASWILNETTCKWEAPVAHPAEDGKFYTWNEASTKWVTS